MVKTGASKPAKPLNRLLQNLALGDYAENGENGDIIPPAEILIDRPNAVSPQIDELLLSRVRFPVFVSRVFARIETKSQ